MNYTIYTKIREKDGGTREVMAVDLPFYCRCPECNNEVEIPLFDEIADDPDFDPYSTRIYCADCSAYFDKIRTRAKKVLADVNDMPVEKLHALSELLDDFEGTEC